MHRYDLIVIVSAILLAAHPVAGQLTITPTTTIAAQTSNNTSAANTFVMQANGNLGAANISKVDVHSLLYPGASTKVYAHLVLWFGQSNHMNVGYNSADPVEIARQVNDMISRGIDGVVMVWYGPNNSIDRAAQLVMKEAENHPGFTFAIMVDHGAILWNSCAGCNPQQALTAQMQYIEQTYFSSPAYLRLNGQPVVTNFDIDLFYQIDWNALSAALTSRPAFLFQNNGGFTHTQTVGAYSWVMPTAANFGLNYLSSFYSAGLTYPSLQTVGAAYKGFNDTLASWSLNRIMSQQCGQTWLQTFATINNLYNSTQQLPMMQLVTWNDYEEGSEIESGIDNCVNLSASISSGNLQWSLTGDEHTIDHYTVYISPDGQNLMPLADLPTGYYSLNLCSYSIPSGKYSLFVQAVGKPTVLNHLAGPISYAAGCGTGSNPSFGLTAAPGYITVGARFPGKTLITVTPQSGAFTQPINLSCANLPLSMSCTFSPATVMPGSATASSLLSISITSAPHQPKPAQKRSPAALSSMLLSFVFAGVLMGTMERRRILRTLIVAMGVALLFSSCGGSAGKSATAEALVSRHTYNVAIVATSASVQVTTHATVAIQ